MTHEALLSKAVEPARVLLVHANYQLRGGEDIVVEAERDLLRSRGHEVIEYRRHNDELTAMPRLRAAVDTLWSRRTVSEMEALLARVKPDIMHVHNTFPLISPSLYWAAQRARVPVVQTLHNFRLMCPQAMFLRDGRVCEDCQGGSPLPGVLHGCYRGSKVQSAGVAGMLVLHRALGTWRDKVDRYIALNDFCRRKFIEGGLPAEKVVVKPNFVDFPRPADGRRSGFLFVGRLSPEKGVGVLAEAMRAVPAVVLRVAGSGPASRLLEGVKGVVPLGALDAPQVRDEMAGAAALVLPSIWYENFPRTLVEAFASGLPVICSRLGALAELVEEGVTGLLFAPGDAADLAAKLKWANENLERMAEMGTRARARYEAEYTSVRNYERLATIYGEVANAPLVNHKLANCDELVRR